MCDLALIAINALLNAGVSMPLEVLDGQLDLKDEGNIAVWYSSLQLSLVALLAGVIACCAAPARSSRWLHRWTWFAIAALALWLSADETAQLHEWLGQRYSDYAGPHDPLAHALRISDIYTWLIVMAIPTAAGAALLVALAINIRQVSRTAGMLSLAAVMCWLGALAAEYAENQRFSETQRRFPGWRGQQATVEEGLELLGAGLLLAAFALFLIARGTKLKASD